MARSARVPGEKALFWVGSAKADLLAFPDQVKDAIGIALSVAQFGGKHPNANRGKEKALASWKSLKTTAVTLIGRSTRCGSERRFMCCMPQKKSPRAAKTARGDVELISKRLKAAQEHYEARFGKRK